MKRHHRLTAIMLAAVMSVSMIPGTAFADEVETEKAAVSVETEAGEAEAGEVNTEEAAAEEVATEEVATEVVTTEEEAVTEGDMTSAGEDKVYSIPGEVEHIDTTGVSTDDSDELFADYVDRIFSGSNVAPAAPAKKLRKAASNLSGFTGIAYNKFREYVAAVAAGERTSTEFELTLEDLGLDGQVWTASDLGVESIIVDGAISEDAVNALLSEINVDMEAVVTHLLSDLPYDMYWYDKTAGVETSSYDFSASNDGSGDVLYLTSGITARFAVASEYALSSYEVDSSVGESVWAAKANADEIIASHSSENDYCKLLSYKNEICDRVSYNHAAAEGGISYGNPWQMIWVFDGDPETNVVCEGYSKAFQYLCDQTDFSDPAIRSIIVTGTMDGGTGAGAHMWNVVTMEDGKHYIADITNCDGDDTEMSVGYPDKLFLAGTASGDAADGYTFVLDSTNVSYIYDDDLSALYDQSDLTLSETDYDPAAGQTQPETEEKQGECGENLTWSLDADGKLTISGTGEMYDFWGGNASWSDYKQDIKSVVIEPGVTKIGESAFYDCENLTGISIPDTVTEIGYCAFEECISLTGITIPEGVQEIKSWTFQNCTSLESITLPESVTGIGSWAFKNCMSLTSITLPKNLSDIGDDIWGGCTSLISFSISADNQSFSIVDGVLFNKEHTVLLCCPEGKAGSYSIPNGVIRLGRHAFESCVNLTSITIPNSVTEIGDEAFDSCTGLTSITIPESVTSIGRYAFSFCTSLTDITIPEGVTNIGSSAFYSTPWCDALGEFGIVNGFLLNYKGEGGDVTIPSDVTVIGEEVFYYNSNLVSITIPVSVRSIGNEAFYKCDGLTSVVYEGTLAQWKEIEIGSGNGELAEVGVQCTDGSASVSWSLEDGVLTISGVGPVKDYDYYDEHAPWYSQRESITSVVIEDGITDIGAYAFFNCINLKSVFIPASVCSIGTYAFYNCTGLENVTCLASKTCISVDAFYYLCDGSFEDGSYTSSLIDGITFHGNADTDIQQFALENNYIFRGSGMPAEGSVGEKITWSFAEDTGTLTIRGEGPLCGSPWQNYDADLIREIIIENGITEICYGAFKNFRKLTGVVLPETVENIREEAFYGCLSLTSVEIPEGVRNIEIRAFHGCTSLTSVTIPRGVSYIDWEVFSGCSGLTSVTIPEGVTYIGSYAFSDCTSLTSVTIPNTVTGIGGGAFSGCTSLESVTISASVTGIGSGAFAGTPWLADKGEFVVSNGTLLAYLGDGGEVVIPSGTTSIGDYVFSDNSNLTGVTIPDGVISIGTNAFAYCENLASVDIPSSVTSIGSGAFEGCKSLAGVDIPSGITSIGSGAFSYCESLASVTIPDGITTIEYCTFAGCTGFTSIVIPENVGYIDDSAFEGCLNLEQITVENPDAKYGTVVFIGTKWYENQGDFVIMNGTLLRYKGENSDVQIPDGVRTINGDALWYHYEVESVSIPGSVESIHSDFFRGGQELKAISVSEDNRFYSEQDGVLYNKDQTKLVYCLPGKEGPEFYVPETVQEIEPLAFTNCSKIQKFYLPAGLKTLGKRADDVTPWAVPAFTFWSEDDSYIPEFYFAGDAPEFGALMRHPCIIYYPEGNSTYTEETKKRLLCISNGVYNEDDMYIEEHSEWRTWTPVAAVIDLEEVVVSDIPDQTYTGTEIQPAPELKYGDTVLTCDTDFTAEYENNTNVGTATITITGKGNYTGTITKTFTINAASIANATVTGISNKTYTGSALKPIPAVKMGDVTLTSDTDYTVAYKNNTKAGTGTVTITGKGNYTGMVTKTFKINAASIASAAVTGISNKTYTGKALTQSPVVKLGTKTLTSGTDYTVSHKNNTKAGTATVTISGKGNYTGTITKTFKISAASIAKAKVTGIQAKTYTGKALTQKPVVKLGSKTLKSGTDYTLSYSSNKNVGQATVKIIGKGNYTGTIKKTFNVNPKGTKLSGLKAASKGFTVKWKKQTAKMSTSKIAGYQIQYSLKSNFASAKTVTVSGVNSASKKISNLTAKKTYYVRIRTYIKIKGKTYYSPWSASKKVKTK